MKNCSLLFFITFLISSCSTERADVDSEAINFENQDYAATIDYNTNLSSSFIEFALDDDSANRSQGESGFMICAQVSRDGQGDGSGTITIDFGDGCTTRDGDFVKGIIFLSYKIVNSNTREVDYTYQDFSINERLIEGGGRVIRSRENDKGNPQAQLSEEIIVTFPKANLTGRRSTNSLREWVEGVGSGTWTDNVYEISGDWNTQLSNGFNREVEVTSVLRRELSCPVIVSGILEFTQNDNNGSLDYGDGTCDAIGVLTINDKSYEIRLR